MSLRDTVEPVVVEVIQELLPKALDKALQEMLPRLIRKELDRQMPAKLAPVEKKIKQLRRARQP